MSVLAFDPYFDDTPVLTAKVAKPAKHEEIRQFPSAKLPDAVAKAAKLGEYTLAGLARSAETLAPGNPQKTSTLATLAGLAISKGETLKSAPSTTVPCGWCGTQSRPFALIVNPENWLCDGCLPSDPNDQVFEATERAAIMGEAIGDARAAVPHAMPCAWPDASMEPTPGARCRLCGGGSWWTECDQPKGWRCLACHPGDHLPAEKFREVLT